MLLEQAVACVAVRTQLQSRRTAENQKNLPLQYISSALRCVSWWRWVPVVVWCTVRFFEAELLTFATYRLYNSTKFPCTYFSVNVRTSELRVWDNDRALAQNSVKIPWLMGTEEGDVENALILNIFEIRKWVNCLRIGILWHFVTCLIRICSLLKCSVQICRKEKTVCSELVWIDCGCRVGTCCCSAKWLQMLTSDDQQWISSRRTAVWWFVPVASRHISGCLPVVVAVRSISIVTACLLNSIRSFTVLAAFMNSHIATLPDAVSSCHLEMSLCTSGLM